MSVVYNALETGLALGIRGPQPARAAFQFPQADSWPIN